MVLGVLGKMQIEKGCVASGLCSRQEVKVGVSALLEEMSQE